MGSNCRATNSNLIDKKFKGERQKQNKSLNKYGQVFGETLVLDAVVLQQTNKFYPKKG